LEASVIPALPPPIIAISMSVIFFESIFIMNAR
jgi:hypothetical protein